VKLDPQKATAWYNMALANKANASLDLSIKCFERFLECSNPMDSRREYALRNLGDHVGKRDSL
jgi:tetratricopeptide (TPR) repeat protein